MTRPARFAWHADSSADKAAVLAGMLMVWSVCPGPVAANDLREQEELAMRAATNAIASSVVRIEPIGGLERVGSQLASSGPTTGLVVSTDGFILSSAFGFVHEPTSILVSLPDGQRTPATIVAKDHSRMTVLLKADVGDTQLHVPDFVRRDEMQVGQWALAIGRTYSVERPNVSAGIVSATNRIWGKAIQTDAKVSPSNYGGPLIDIHGRVLGILVPMSPREGGELAGTQWYDSGIGFAVPLAESMARIEQMKQGTDLFPGILGITFKGNDIYTDAPVIGACFPNSPAAKAGLKAGDRIIEIDAMQVTNQAEFKHILGPYYAQDTIALVAARGDDRINVDVELIDKLQPYEHPFIGILPMRHPDQQSEAVIVRYVYPNSPADKTGITTGDRITKIGDVPVENIGVVYQELSAHLPGDGVSVTVASGDETRVLDIVLASLPVEIPDQLPPARDFQPAEDNKSKAGKVEIRLAGEPNECFAYVPETYADSIRHGLIVWLHAPGEYDAEESVTRWKKFCAAGDFILLAPRASDEQGWSLTEIDYIQKLIDHVVNQYNIDESRIVAHGYQGGGAFAYHIAFQLRKLVRAVAAVDAALPSRLRPPVNDPLLRTAVFSASSPESRLSPLISAGVDNLRSLKYPVTIQEQSEDSRYLNEAELRQLVRWVDTLDRL